MKDIHIPNPAREHDRAAATGNSETYTAEFDQWSRTTDDMTRLMLRSAADTLTKLGENLPETASARDTAALIVTLTEVREMIDTARGIALVRGVGHGVTTKKELRGMLAATRTDINRIAGAGMAACPPPSAPEPDAEDER